jgi:4-hydroxy-3-polyprenylbenzoate decarboxylase
MSHRLALLVTGASGMLLPVRALGLLTEREDVERIHLVVSKGASLVLVHEERQGRGGPDALLEAAGLDREQREKVVCHRDSELDAPISSGSYRLTGAAVLPCSAATLGALATGSGSSLVHRAGAVALKERWPLVLGFRETPYSLVHIENMRRLTYAGAVVHAPVPAFYIGEEDIDRFVDAYLLRLFDLLGLAPKQGEELRWTGS